ncbi:MAG: hypothetical protein R2706_19585 [Acidimicrobiales bacterium]
MGADGTSISTASNPFIDCTILWSLTGDQAADYGGAKGQALGKVSPDMSLSTERFHFMSCPFAQPAFWEVWPETDPVPATIISAVQQAALARIQIPIEPPQTNPPGTEDFPKSPSSPPGFGPTTGPPLIWHSFTRRIERSVRVLVTITATPAQTVWSPGDGSAPITCQAGTHGTRSGRPTTSRPVAIPTPQGPPGTPFTITVNQTWHPDEACARCLCANLRHSPTSQPRPAVRSTSSRSTQFSRNSRTSPGTLQLRRRRRHTPKSAQRPHPQPSATRSTRSRLRRIQRGGFPTRSGHRFRPVPRPPKPD